MEENVPTGKKPPKTPAPAGKPPNIHRGHRFRLRERYSRSGLDDFAPHEVLELLLTYCIPQKDVNGYAHALVARFGSVAAVLDASPTDLQSVEGIGPEAARFLSMQPSLYRYYATDKATPREPMETLAKISAYLRNLYVGATREKVYLLLFDNSMCLIDACLMGEGAVNCSQITMRRMAETVFLKNASAVVLAHNHPGGLAIPSSSDREVTDHVVQALELIQVPLLEHIIVTENSYAPILRNYKGLLRASPMSDRPDESFYRTFYGEGNGS